MQKKYESQDGQMRASRLGTAALAIGLALSTTGCAGFGKAIGAAKTSPDEFAVVTKAPLVIPPDFSLRPPQPGASRPQETDVAEAARNAVFNGAPAQATDQFSDGERILLSRAGAEDADDSIRDAVDSEYYNIHHPDDGLANKILFWKGETVDPSTLVDAEAEAARVRESEALGEPIMDEPESDPTQ